MNKPSQGYVPSAAEKQTTESSATVSLVHEKETREPLLEKDVIEQLHSVGIGILLAQFRDKYRGMPARTLSDLEGAISGWYKEHYMSRMSEQVRYQCEHILKADSSKQQGCLEQAQQQVAEFFTQSFVEDKYTWPEAQEVKARAANVGRGLEGLFAEVIGKYNLLTGDQQKLVAEYILTSFQQDLNVYRPDFASWDFSKTIYQQAQLANPEHLPAEQNRQGFRTELLKTLTKYPNAKFKPFDQGLELAYAVLTNPVAYPPAVWSGVCEAKVLRVLASDDFATALKLKEEDSKLQMQYIENEGAKDEFLTSACGLKEWTGTVLNCADESGSVANLVLNLTECQVTRMFKLSILHAGIGGHAIAMKKVHDNLLCIYDPNLGLLENVTPKLFGAIWQVIYGQLGYTRFAISELVSPEEAKKRADERIEQEKKSRAANVPFDRPKITGRRPPTRPLTSQRQASASSSQQVQESKTETKTEED